MSDDNQGQGQQTNTAIADKAHQLDSLLRAYPGLPIEIHDAWAALLAELSLELQGTKSESAIEQVQEDNDLPVGASVTGLTADNQILTNELPPVDAASASGPSAEQVEGDAPAANGSADQQPGAAQPDAASDAPQESTGDAAKSSDTHDEPAAA